MQVNVRNGKPVVKLTKKEEKALSDASHVLITLANYADCKTSEEAVNLVDLVIKKHASHVEEKSAAQPTDSGTETAVPGAVPDVPDTDVQTAGSGTARGRKGSVSPHGIV